MDQPLYDIICTGQLVEGTQTAEAQEKLAQMFKTSSDKVAHFFEGKPHALKRGVDKATALKYKAALHKAGIVVAFKAHQSPQAAPATSESPAVQQASSQESTAKAAPAEGSMTLAPAGSDVLTEEERKPEVVNDIDTSAIQLTSPFLEPEPEPSDAPPAPDTNHISMAEVGSDLNPDRPAPLPELELDLDELSLAPAGADLEELHDDLPPLDPDISQLSMAPAGSDLLEGQTKAAPPPAPDTSHLSVSKDS